MCFSLPKIQIWTMLRLGYLMTNALKIARIIATTTGNILRRTEMAFIEFGQIQLLPSQ